MKAKIYFQDGKDITIENKTITFEEFTFELFKGKIYLSITSNECNNLAMNTENILFVEEER